MNKSTNPFVPQGSLLEQKIRSRSRFRTAFFCVLAVNLIPITIALLMQGCRKPATDESQTATDTNALQTPNLEFTNPPLVEPTQTQTAVATSTLTATPGSLATEYTVKAGDSFSTIVKNFPGVTLKQIQEANPTVDPRRLQIGQKLQIPAALPAATPVLNGAAVPDLSTGELTYTVKSGDTLTKIATDHGTTVRAIRSLNNLPTDRITVGQKLKIPPRAIAPPPPPAPVVAPATSNPPA